MAKIRVQLIDDHSVVRAGVRLLVDYQSDMEVVAEAASAMEGVRQACATRPDVVLLDIGLPGCSGLDAIEPILKASPQSRILILSAYDDPEYLRTALARGAAGYLDKQAGPTELTEAIRAVAAGRSAVIVKQAVKQDLETVAPGRAQASAVDALSKREKQVLTLIGSGETNQAAARQLGISVKTVETYRRRLMDKLEISDRAGLVRAALESGLIAIPRNR